MFHPIIASLTDVDILLCTVPINVASRDTQLCPKCAERKNGKGSCCAEGGTWEGKCGTINEYLEHTWAEGVSACLGELALRSCMKVRLTSMQVDGEVNNR